MGKGYHLTYVADKELADRCMKYSFSGLMFSENLETAADIIEKKWAHADHSRETRVQTHYLISEKGLASVCRNNFSPFSVGNIGFLTLTADALKDIAQELGLPYERKNVRIEVS